MGDLYEAYSEAERGLLFDPDGNNRYVKILILFVF